MGGRGQSSTCSRLGQDLHAGAMKMCAGKCAAGFPTTFGCTSDAGNPEKCVCEAYCKRDWTQPYDLAGDGIEPDHKGILINWEDWFGWNSFEATSYPAETLFVGSSDSFCSRELYEDQKDECLKAKGAAECSAIFTAWQKAEDCADGMIAESKQCSKVCEWVDHEIPPKIFLRKYTYYVMQPLTFLVVILSIWRLVILLMRACSIAKEYKYDAIHDISGISDVTKELSSARGAPGYFSFKVKGKPRYTLTLS